MGQMRSMLRTLACTSAARTAGDPGEVLGVPGRPRDGRLPDGCSDLTPPISARTDELPRATCPRSGDSGRQELGIRLAQDPQQRRVPHRQEQLLTSGQGTRGADRIRCGSSRPPRQATRRTRRGGRPGSGRDRAEGA
ncbi:hypothetical protein ACFW40_19840 [Streptomyces sp. NPDC058807]|uniref:hypothetical protein n=1 Tax=unclassified Streptomyces TaxID=2593676 RepID=UPI003681DE64